MLRIDRTIIAQGSRNRTQNSIEGKIYGKAGLHGSLPCRPYPSALLMNGQRLSEQAEPVLHHEQPLVAPQLTHFRQVPLRTIVNCLHSGQGSPSYPFTLALCTSVRVRVSRLISTCLATL